MGKKDRLPFGRKIILLIFLLPIFIAGFVFLWQRGKIDAGNVVKLQWHFAVDGDISRVADYRGEPCVAYRGGFFTAMESYQVPLFQRRGKNIDLIEVAYIPANGAAPKEMECVWGTRFRTQVNTWFTWKEGRPFVIIRLEKIGGGRE